MIEKVYAPDGVYAGLVWCERRSDGIAYRAENRAGTSVPCVDAEDARAWVLDQYARFGLAPAMLPTKASASRRMAA